MLFDIIIGSVCILIGIIIGVFTYKNPNKLMDSFNWKGYIASAGFIILGVMCFIGKGGDLVVNIKKVFNQ